MNTAVVLPAVLLGHAVDVVLAHDRGEADDAGAFTGLIDFGDAYAAHPALDLRSWPNPADRIGLREAYLDGRAPGAEWDAVWTVAMIYADLGALTGPTLTAAPAAADLVQRLDQL